MRATPHETGHCSIGTGVDLSGYALDLSFQPGLSVENGKFLAAFCIKAAKDHVATCGGRTRIDILKEDGSGWIAHHVLPGEVSEAERYADDLLDTLQHVVTCLDYESHNDDTVDSLMEYFRESIIRFRKKRKAQEEKARRDLDKARATLALRRLKQREQQKS